jgi:putative ABC transport system permease protein
MLRLTLAQMRRSVGRLVAAGIAITISTAFVAATLLASAAITRTTYDAVTSSYAGADLVVSDGEVTDRTVQDVQDLPGVDSVHAYTETYANLSGPDGLSSVGVAAAAQDPRLESSTVATGALPTAEHQIALTAPLAELLGVEIGDTVHATLEGWREPTDGATEVTVETRTDDLVVVGTVGGDGAPFDSSGDTAVVSAGQLDSWLTFQDPTSVDRWYWHLLVAVADDASVPQVQQAIMDVVDDGTAVRTLDEQAEAVTAELTGSTDVMTALVLAFAAVALLVAALVITNTFQVLIAQRTRTLALLRCVGADRNQLRRSVIAEALMLGVSASALGTGLGVAVVQVALTVLTRAGTDVPLPSTVTISAGVLVLPLLCGTAITVLAALSPARAATRVAPLAALRPADAPRATERSGRVRLISSLVLLVGGVAGLVLGITVASRYDLMIGLGIGVLAGVVSFVGMLLGSVFWVPRLVGWIGGLAARSGGTAARLAAANSIRNPRRTASTSAALFIGVTLVAMMSTGAASTRSALDQSLQAQFPVDVAVGEYTDGTTVTALPPRLSELVSQVDGVATVTGLTGTVLQVRAADAADGEWSSYIDGRGVEPAGAQAVLNAPEQVDGLDASTVIMSASMAEMLQVGPGDELTVRRQSAESAGSGGPGEADELAAAGARGAADVGDPATPEADGRTLTLTTVITELPGWALVLTPENLAAVAPGAPVTRLWVQIEDLDAAEQVVADITQVASDTGTSLAVTGGAVERAFYQRVVTTLLTVVLGLLGVAVLIALVGVTNTLSLSVIERRRESATLRAIGLSRGQLRGTLAIEGMLIAGVGALVGAVLGTLYGWAGAQTLLGEIAEVGLTVPWSDLGIVLVVSLLAGVLASVLPGRAAAQTSPVAALAVE